MIQLLLNRVLRCTYRVGFSRDDRLLISGPEYGSIKVWDRRRGALMPLETSFQDEKLTDVCFSEDGEFLVVARRSSLETWNIIPVAELSDTQVRTKIAFQAGLSA